MLNLIHRILRWFPAETAHHLGIFGMRAMQWFTLRSGPVRWSPANIVIGRGAVSSLRFRNRLGLAAGFDKNAEVFPAAALLGFGFVEIGTVTPLPQSGNPKPRLWRLSDDTLLNHMGFNSDGWEMFLQRINRYRRRVPNLPLFANVGKNRATPNERAIDDYAFLVDKLAASVDGFVVNLSSPNTPGLTQLQDVGFLMELASRLKTDRPVLIKVSPDLESETMRRLVEFVRAENRFSGVVATNTSNQLARQKFGRENGGISGGPLFEKSLDCLVTIRKALGNEKVLIGVGGVSRPEQALRMREAGADLIEIYTAFALGGPKILKDLASHLGK